MEKRRLGNSDLHLTALGFGAWAMGGARSAEQVGGFIAAGDFRLTADEVKEVEDFVRGAQLPQGEPHA